MAHPSVVLVALALVLACNAGSGDDAADGSAGTTGSASTAGDTGSTGASTTIDTVTGESDGSGSSGSETTMSATTGTGDESSSSASDSSGGETGDEANVLYVRDDGLDGNPGTRDEPMRTIQWAITQAGVLGGIDTIRVAEGDYEVDYANAAHIVMVEGVSLVGGWRADWDDHDPDVYASNIVDVSVTDVPTTESDPHRAVEIPEGLTSATVLDGFRIGIARGQYRASVFVAGDATLSNNVIAPNSDDDPVWITGVRVQSASPTVIGNRIVIDGGDVAGFGSGIHAMDSDGLFANNVITLSNTTSGIYGVYLSQGEVQLLANSIHAGDNSNIWLVYMIAAATPTIDNNVLEAVDFGGVCLGSNAASSEPTFTRNNVLDCNYTLFGSDPLRNWTTIQQLQDNTDGASANLKLLATIVDPEDDLALAADVPCTVTQGGRDLGAVVTVDIDDVARTVPLSIGAHEWDGGCS